MNFRAAHILAAAGDGAFSFLTTLKGPEFLALFAGWFVLTFLTVLVLRWRGYDTPFTTIIGLICFELLGVARIVDGSAHGMHKWDLLILMMVVGGFGFFIRVKNFNRSDGSRGSSWSSCSGGCGGGGGCGGCGGS